jgi:hypothetical protein
VYEDVQLTLLSQDRVKWLFRVFLGQLGGSWLQIMIALRRISDTQITSEDSMVQRRW